MVCVCVVMCVGFRRWRNACRVYYCHSRFDEAFLYYVLDTEISFVK